MTTLRVNRIGMSDARFIVGRLLDEFEVDHVTHQPRKTKVTCVCAIEAKNAKDTTDLKAWVEYHMTSIVGRSQTRFDITAIKDESPTELNTKRSDTQTNVSVTYAF